MQTLFDYHEDECPWYYFDSSFKTLLGSCLIVFGVFGVLLNGWLFATFIHSHLVVFKSHLLVLNLCSASLGRNLLGFPFAASSAIAKRWLFSPACCQLQAYLNQFFGVFQMIAIFVFVLERYLLAKYYKKEQTLHLRFYWSLIGSCWITAVVFATPPLFGYGLYSCDTSGTTCTFLWPSLISGAKHLGFTVPYIFICAILPVIAMWVLGINASKQLGENLDWAEQYLWAKTLLRHPSPPPHWSSCLPGRVMFRFFKLGMSLTEFDYPDYIFFRFYFMGKAIRLEKIYYRSEQQKEQKRLTKSVHALATATLALWIPAGVLAGWQWLPLLILGYRPHVPSALALFAPIASEAATSIPVLSYLAADERLRAALLGRMRKNYALLPPHRAKRYNFPYKRNLKLET